MDKTLCCPDVTINGTLYKVTIDKVGENEYELYCSPCTLPSAVYNVARIRMTQNRCMQFEFYEFRIYTDPVETILDCNLCQGVRRAIERYVEDIGNGLGTSCCNRWFF